jgi:hypothetical protein
VEGGEPEKPLEDDKSNRFKKKKFADDLNFIPEANDMQLMFADDRPVKLKDGTLH